VRFGQRAKDPARVVAGTVVDQQQFIDAAGRRQCLAHAFDQFAQVVGLVVDRDHHRNVDARQVGGPGRHPRTGRNAPHRADLGARSPGHRALHRRHLGWRYGTLTGRLVGLPIGPRIRFVCRFAHEDSVPQCCPRPPRRSAKPQS